MTTPLDFLANLAGQQIPGGCDDCDAYQTMTQHESGAWIMTVHHDDDCPFLTARRGRQRIQSTRSGIPRGLRK